MAIKLDFNPTMIGKLEVSWWEAHHEKNKPQMAKFLIQQQVALYHLTFEEAQNALSDLVKGVKYHDTREWKKAVQSVTKYYKKIKEKTKLNFDPQKAAKLEVGWWKIHDELEKNPDKTELAQAFAKLYAALFGLEINQLSQAGKLKAEATREHDLAEIPGISQKEANKHWKKAKQLLISFYTELKKCCRRNKCPAFTKAIK